MGGEGDSQVNNDLSNDLSIIELVLNASIVVQAILAMLLMASVLSWTMILRKRAELSRARAAADRFEDDFWAGREMTAMFRAIEERGVPTTGMESIFEFGFREFSRLRRQGIPADQLIEGCRRAMKVALLKETDRLESNLSMLATVGSTSPYVGLLGTVWGIMSAFQGLGNMQQATLSTVAPGIAEALVATAMGLVAAIPAVVSYNRYADRVNRLELRFDTFVEELSTLLQRHANTRSSQVPPTAVERSA
jgi:biopolymer transport protein TolQ